MSYLGENVPKLGFGMMRLPKIGEEIDIEQTKRMVDIFLENGFTYFDTAYGYNNGKSEAAAKVALIDRYPRDSFLFATKLPAWAGAKTAEEARQMFWTSLERTGAGYFDYYLLHNIDEKRGESFEKFGIWDFVAELKEKGLVRHMGFSFHDSAEALEKLLNKHPEAEFVQLQINYADWEDNVVESRKCLEVARAHGKSVIIMEPVKGGLLAKLPESAAAILRETGSDASQASWAIRFAASQEGVITVLSGMSNIEQMEDNVSFMRDFKPLDASERETVERVRRELESIPTIPCTNCCYCVKGCPQQVQIPRIFSVANRYKIYNDLNAARGNYQWETREGGKASECVACGACEQVCPQHIHIIDELKNAAEIFETAN